MTPEQRTRWDNNPYDTPDTAKDVAYQEQLMFMQFRKDKIEPASVKSVDTRKKYAAWLDANPE